MGYSMDKKITAVYLVLSLTIFSFGIASAFENEFNIPEKSETSELYDNGENYGVQWEMNYGSDWSYGARYEGPQPIGYCDNDGKNEINAVSVMVYPSQDYMYWFFKYGWYAN